MLDCGGHTCLREQVLEELLVVDARHAADLCYLALGCRVSVDEVGRDADCQLASQLLVLKTLMVWKIREEEPGLMKARSLNMAVCVCFVALCNIQALQNICASFCNSVNIK